jgi:hypothetical protein
VSESSSAGAEHGETYEAIAATYARGVDFQRKDAKTSPAASLDPACETGVLGGSAGR